MDVVSSNAPCIINVATRDTNANALGNYKVYIGVEDKSELIFSPFSIFLFICSEYIQVNYFLKRVEQR